MNHLSIVQRSLAASVSSVGTDSASGSDNRLDESNSNYGSGTHPAECGDSSGAGALSMSMSLESSQEKEFTLLRLPFSSDEHSNGKDASGPNPYHTHGKSNRYMESTTDEASSTALSATGSHATTHSQSRSKNGSKSGSRKKDKEAATAL